VEHIKYRISIKIIIGRRASSSSKGSAPESAQNVQIFALIYYVKINAREREREREREGEAFIFM